MSNANVRHGIKISKNDNGMCLSQLHYIEKVLKKFDNFDLKHVSTPFDLSVKLTKK